MKDFDKNPADMFPKLPTELAGAQADVHKEFRRLADIAAQATFRARKVSASGAEPELTEEEQYAIAYVSGLRSTTGLMIGGKLQMRMPPCQIVWDKNEGRFMVVVDE